MRKTRLVAAEGVALFILRRIKMNFLPSVRHVSTRAFLPRMCFVTCINGIPPCDA